jgi:predicted permease
MILGGWASHGISDLRLASEIPVRLDFGIDWRVFLYALAAAVCTGVIVGLWPALRVTRSNVNETLREGGRSGSSGAARHRVRSILVAAQLAGSLMVLIVAGLFVRSLQHAQQMYLGFDPDHVVNVVLDPHEVGYDEKRTTNFFRELENHVRTLPGVKSVSLAYSVPMGSYSDSTAVNIERHPVPAGQQPPNLLFNSVDSAYLQTMKIPLLRGRSFGDSDNETAPHVAIVNQTMAKKMWPNEDPIGKCFTTEETKGIFWQVVGVTQDGKYGLLAEDPQSYFYLPLAQHFVSMRKLQIRASINREALMLSVQQEIKNLDSGLPIFMLRTMNDSLAGANGFMIFRIGALLASSIGAMGLTLAVVGVYGVVAFAASQRTREIGIRMALGANRTQVLKLVLRQGVWVVVAGAALGLIAALGINRGIANLLVGVGPDDPLTLVTATSLLVAVALYACYVPARRAMKVDPMVALRYE